ncbi:hypothetical protein [Streptomyces sp. NPDC093589]|uniref:hypothetical protein n=1 Tax=Streptomyces sp. NPDC093589 TaxID=3366043 RepID=UPI00382118E3
MTATPTETMSPDEITAWLANNLDQFNTDETITPFTLIARHPGLGHLRAANALRALADSGLLHRTARPSVFALRADLPTSGDGHVWLRVSNRAGAPVEVMGDKPRPENGRWTEDVGARWTCHGCAENNNSGWYPSTVEAAQQHAEECRGQHLGT